jgi:hypothetical protein
MGPQEVDRLRIKVDRSTTALRLRAMDVKLRTRLRETGSDLQDSGAEVDRVPSERARLGAAEPGYGEEMQHDAVRRAVHRVKEQTEPPPLVAASPGRPGWRGGLLRDRVLQRLAGDGVDVADRPRLTTRGGHGGVVSRAPIGIGSVGRGDRGASPAGGPSANSLHTSMVRSA